MCLRSVVYSPICNIGAWAVAIRKCQAVQSLRNSLANSFHAFSCNINCPIGNCTALEIIVRKHYSFLIFFTALIGLLLFQSCQSVNKDKVKETVENFFSAYRGEDFTTAVAIYPKLSSLRGQFRKSSRIDLDLKDIWVISDSNIIVNLTHHWVNPFGADNTAKMRLYLTKKGDRYEIFDSKNFCMYDDVSLHKFACNVGAIKTYRDTTDIAISAKLDDVVVMYNFAVSRVMSDIKNGLTVKWTWENGYYSDYASGRAVVTNNTAYPVKQPKYTVTYYKSDNKTIVTTDDGIVCYDVLMPNQSKSFSWYTSYIGNASRAGVTVNCDNNSWIEEIVTNLPFVGLEYDKYKNGAYWWPL